MATGLEYFVETVGFVGSGAIGSTVARLASEAGYPVALSNSRGPETLRDLAVEIGDRATAVDIADAAASDIVVVAIPFGTYESLPAEAFAGKTVIDAMNYYPARDGRLPVLDAFEVSESELLQRHLPEARIVKCFNNVYCQHLRALAKQDDSGKRSALPIAGDDLAAKEQVSRFVSAIGFDVLDVGELAAGWRFEPEMPAYAGAYRTDACLESEPSPLSLDQLGELIGKARRGSRR